MDKKKSKWYKKYKKVKRKIRYTFLYYAIMALIFLSQFVPRRLWLNFFGGIGSLAYYLARQSRRLTLKHLTMVYGKEMAPSGIKKLAKDVFRKIGMNGADLIKGFNITEQSKYEKIVVSKGIEHAEAARVKGKGVMFLTAHYGAFEFLSIELAIRGYKPFIVGTPLKDKRLNDLLWEHRTKLGATAIERGKDLLKVIRNLKSGGSMIILIDQDTKVKSCFVNFFGIPCATPIGSSFIAMKTGAAVVPVMIHLREDLMQECNYYPEVPLVNSGDEEADLVVNTQRMTDACELEIKKNSTQWLWMHERWKTKPGEEI
jgi:KDO2-lipid IV(A) lauroyltransferase